MPGGTWNRGSQRCAPSSTTLVSWTLDASAAPGVRVTSLRRLEEQDGDAALGAAERLLDSPDTDALLRSNAVAVLARSSLDLVRGGGGSPVEALGEADAGHE